jgi:hypothetical protein
MGAAHRWCLRAALLAGMVGIFVASLLPACQFPYYAPPSGGGEGGVGGAIGGATGAGGTLDGGRAGAAGSDGGVTDGGSAGEGGEGGKPEPCPTDACAPKAPSGGWKGPVVVWEAAPGSMKAPDCPAGYTDPQDRHRELVAPGGCGCTCQPTGESCDTDTQLEIYTDMSCAAGGVCAKVQLSGCTPISGCTGSQGSVYADAPTPMGGSCVDHVAPPPDPTWKFDARICSASDVQTCDSANEICAPRPPSPFEPALCVMREFAEGEPVAACPDGFDNSRMMYSTLTDGRTCTPCTCSPLGPGECQGSLILSTGSDCNGSTQYTPGQPCKQFNLGSGPVFPKSVKGQWTIKSGACSVVTSSKPVGSAVEARPLTLVCCP